MTMGKHIPLRMCVCCRQMFEQNTLIRIVNENGAAVLDTEKKHFGRGAYICTDEKCLAKAKKKHIPDRHIKCHVPDELYEQLTKLQI